MSLQACPECVADVPVGASPELNELIECPECAGELEVISLEPLTLAVAPEVEEDWGE
ncbi:lysine biosynthesis protein LysW [Actinoplanes sp. NEAU-A12]|uniref:Lysine biosynthesis protein LysW n=1 Tax=Actinoplanes sandaracinus TaxID=3045177 RepID=A0ABT6WTB9_9ACTN|nr:lysine biosynthesis protein LysW [Actinoplanes sandaracinus]MDI6102997.1 lysine biosynthesis protein LysW [Actinoplanes sandaracinus]